MNIRDYSSQFTVFVFGTNVDHGAAAKVSLSQAGYDAFYFQNGDTLEQALQESPPHLLVFWTDSLSGVLSDFVTEVQKYNDEIRFVAVANSSQFSVLAQYNDHGFVDVIPEEGASIDERVTWSVDRACEKLYLNYQNEQLYDQLLKSQKLVEEVQAAARSQGEKLRAAESAQEKTPLSVRLVEYRSGQSKEDLIQKFLNNISDSLCIYFKFLVPVRSFVATHANAIPAKEIQGVGCQLDADDIRELPGQLVMGLLPQRFLGLLAEAFQISAPRVFPLYANGQLEGIFVCGKLSDARKEQVTEEFSLMSLCYSHFVLEKKVDSLEVQDFVTELFNRNHYGRVLAEELERARRLRQPLSVVKVAMDDFYEMESSLGEAARDELLKSLGAVITKTSRANDVTCRTGMNEIAMILPHCSRNGAALRAERLRRIIEGSSFLNSGMKISVSVGVSEYPTLCDSAKSLDETAGKALSHIIDKGGNKLCLFKAPEGYRPEFEVTAE